MIVSTRDEIVARIERAAEAEPQGVLAFDGDGTLWSGDVGEDFYAAMLDAPLTAMVHHALGVVAQEAGIDDRGTPRELAHRVRDAYRAGQFPEERMCEVMTWIAAGWTVSELDAFARDLVVRLELALRFHPEAVSTLAYAHRRGWTVYVVSASPRAIVTAAAATVGVDAAHVVASREATDRLTVLADVERPIPYGPGKVTRLREKIGARPLWAAFGDNAFDVAMLREARVPAAIRPKSRLAALAHEVPGLVQMAP